jgi:hypothetical protein
MTIQNVSPARARLNVDGLSSVDMQRVQAFLPYCRGRTRYHWQLAEAGDTGDALFVDADEPATISGAHRIDGGIVRIRRRDAAEPPPGDHMMLASPLQLEEFIATLRCIEVRLARFSGMAGPVPDPVAAEVSTDVAYRLRRWPPTGVLVRHRYNARLASFMSTRHLTTRQLSLFSNVDGARCGEFIADLLAIDLLDARTLHAGSATEAAAALSAGTGSVGAAAGLPRRAGLLQRIRRRLALD